MMTQLDTHFFDPLETPRDSINADLIYSLVGDEMPAHDDPEDFQLALAARPLIPVVHACHKK